MAYITLQDVLDKLGEDILVQLTDNADTGEINEVVVNNAIATAEGTFEAYVRTRYTLPVPATQMVKTRCLNLAIYELYRERATFEDGVFKVKKTAYDETISLLRDIQSGKAALDVPAAEETIANPTTGDQVLTNASKSKFSDTKLSSF
jgi:phage gp36-like protein